MLTPPPVSGQAYPVGLTSQEHANSLHYGVIFTPAYSDNVLGTTTGQQVADMSYSLWPTIGVDETSSHLRWDFTYAPGFTFYQHTSERNQADHNARLSFEYRLSPDVTFSAQDSFQKSSRRWFVQQAALYRPKPVPGLYDSSSQMGSAFYMHRALEHHYIGVAYLYARLMSYPAGLDADTQTRSVFPFYTVFVTPRLSMSFFGSSQYSNTVQPAVGSPGYPAFAMRSWSPSGGVSLSYQGQFVSGSLTCSHRISDGGGLPGAVTADNATGSIGLQLSRSLTGFISGSAKPRDWLQPSGPAAIRIQFRSGCSDRLGNTSAFSLTTRGFTSCSMVALLRRQTRIAPTFHSLTCSRGR